MALETFDDLGITLLTDKIIAVREGSPDNSGYLTAQSLVTLAQTELSPSDQIIINDITDLQPYLTAGEYVIPTNKGFCFTKDIILNYPIKLPIITNYADPSTAFTSIVGGGIGGNGYIKIIYTGSGAFIRGTYCPGLVLEKLNFVSANPLNQLFNIANGSNSALWAPTFIISDCFIYNYSDCGFIEGFNLSAGNKIAFIGCGKGINFQNFASLGMGIISWANGQNLSLSYAIKLTGLIGRFSIADPTTGITQTNESLIWIDNNIIAERILLIGLSITGTGRLFHASGKNQDSSEVVCYFCPPFPDSNPVVFATSTTETLTTIGSANVFTHVVLPAGGYTDRLIKRFSKIENTNGSGIFDVLKYDGIESVDINIVCQLTARAVSGSPTARLALNLNGTALSYTGFPTILAATNTPLRTEGILTLTGALNGTYTQTSTSVTLTFHNSDLNGNPLHITGEKHYIKINSGTSLSGIYTITSHTTTSITYTSSTALTTSGNASIHDILKIDIENQSAATNINTSNINLQLIL
jgi:hypothetical protein